MELRHLRYFQAVARHLNFTRAADQLHVAQPALSRQIMALEDELGARLFDRNRQRVQLTDAGRTFFTHVEKVLAEVEMARAAVHGVAGGDGGELIIGNDWRISVGVVPDAIAEFHRQCPQAEVTLRELATHEQSAALHAHKIHIGFLPRVFIARHAEFEQLTILKSELIVVVPATHRHAGRRKVRIAELADETWLQAGSPEHSYRDSVTQICRLAGFSPIFGKPVESISTMLSVIASGAGIGLMPRFLLGNRQRSLRFLRTDCDPLEMNAVWRRDDGSLLRRRFVGILRERTGARQPVKKRRA